MILRVGTGTIVALALASALGARAEEEPSPRDLVPGDTAFGQEKGDFELEFETLFLREADARELELRLGFEYGLTERLQLSLDFPYAFEDPHEHDEPSVDGFGRSELAIQAGLLSAEAPMALSLALATEFPIAGRSGPGDDDVGFSANLLAAWLFGRTELFAGVEWAWDGDRSDPSAEIGVVVARAPYAFEAQLAWSEDEDGAAWEIEPGLVVEDVGPFDVGFGFPYVVQPGRDAWGVSLTLTWGP